MTDTCLDLKERWARGADLAVDLIRVSRLMLSNRASGIGDGKRMNLVLPPLGQPVESGIGEMSDAPQGEVLRVQLGNGRGFSVSVIVYSEDEDAFLVREIDRATHAYLSNL